MNFDVVNKSRFISAAGLRGQPRPASRESLAVPNNSGGIIVPGVWPLPLPTKCSRMGSGYPAKILIPTKLGFENRDWVIAISVTTRYWIASGEDYVCSWSSGS